MSQLSEHENALEQEEKSAMTEKSYLILHWLMHFVTTSNQLTSNPKDGKDAFSGIPTQVHHCLPRRFTSFTT